MTRTLHSHFPGVKSIKIIMKIRPLIVWKFWSFPSVQHCSTAAKGYRWQRNFVVIFKISAVFLLLMELSHYYKQVLKHGLFILNWNACPQTSLFINQIAQWWLLCWQVSQSQVEVGPLNIVFCEISVTPLTATLNMRSSSSVEVSNGSLIGSSSAAGGLGAVSTAGT